MNNIKKSRVHPLVIIDTLIKGLKLNGILILLALKEQNWKLNLLIFAGILLLIVVGIFDYFLKSYEVRDGAFIYTTGIINKKVKNINLENIQSIDTSSNILYQSFDLLSVDINLVGDNIKIKPLKKDVALFLIEILNKIRKSEECTFLEEEKVEVAQKEILKLSVKTLHFMVC